MAVMRGASLHSLPDSALLAVLRLLPPLERRVVVPLVCKRFAALAAASTDLWQQVQLSIPVDFRQSVSLPDLYAWFVRREGLVRSLHVSIGTDDAWAPLLALLGVAGRGLEHLRIAGDGQSCAVAGCTAPWLALTPNLRSLELDDVCDHSIGEALWPAGKRPPLLRECRAACMSSSPACAGGWQGFRVGQHCAVPKCMRRSFARRCLRSGGLLRAPHAARDLIAGFFMQALHAWSSATAERKGSTVFPRMSGVWGRLNPTKLTQPTCPGPACPRASWLCAAPSGALCCSLNSCRGSLFLSMQRADAAAHAGVELRHV